MFNQINRPIFKQSIQSCSGDNCNCCHFYSSEEDDDDDNIYTTSTSSLTSTTSSSSTNSTCSCNDRQELKKRRPKSELDWIDHFTDRNGIIFYMKYLDHNSNNDDNQNEFSNNIVLKSKSIQRKFKRRSGSNYINKLTDWANGTKSSTSKDQLITLIKKQQNDLNNLNNEVFINRLFNLVKDVIMNNKTNDKLTKLNELNDKYIEESGILTIICLNKLQSDDVDDTNDNLRYAYSRPVDLKLIDTNLLDNKRIIKLNGLHLTLANLIEKLIPSDDQSMNNQLKESKIALPRVTLLRTQELTKINLIYEHEDNLLIKFLIANNYLTLNQFENLTKSIIRLIKFEYGNLKNAFLNSTNQTRLTKLFNLISFLLDNQLNKHELINLEFTNDLHLCEQLTINIELLQLIQQVMIDFECLTWINEYEIRKLYRCFNSCIFYKGKLICSNIYQHDQSQSDLKLYLKLNGLLNLTKLAKIKFIKWLPIYIESIDKSSCLEKFYLLIIAVDHILYATIWKLDNADIIPKQLINEGLHFIVRLIKKTNLIEELDYELRLQTYWYSIPLDELTKDKRCNIIQKSFDFYSQLNLNSQFKIDNLNKVNQLRRAFLLANIHRNLHINSELKRKEQQKSSSFFNFKNIDTSKFYSSLRSSTSTINTSSSLNSQRSSIQFESNLLTNQIQCELNSLSRTYRQIKQFMINNLICYLIQDNQNSIYQSPLISNSLLKRFGDNNLFIKKFKQNCLKLDRQLNYLDINEIGLSFESKLPTFLNTSNNKFNKEKDKIILPLSTIKNDTSSLKTIKFWLHLIKLDRDHFVYLCFLDNNQIQQKDINNFLFNNLSKSRFR